MFDTQEEPTPPQPAPTVVTAGTSVAHNRTTAQRQTTVIWLIKELNSRVMSSRSRAHRKTISGSVVMLNKDKSLEF